MESNNGIHVLNQTLFSVRRQQQMWKTQNVNSKRTWIASWENGTNCMIMVEPNSALNVYSGRWFLYIPLLL